VDKIKFGIVAPAGEEPKRVLDYIKRAEDSGIDSFWAGDHMTFMKPVAYDVISTLTAAGMMTNNITLASISDAHKHHPAVLAQRLSTIDHLLDGRFILGLGLGEAMNLDPYGIKWNKPLSRMTESINIIRTLWERNEPFDFQGKFFNLEKAILGAKPTAGKVPIYIAAHRSKSLRAAAELGDGWITLPQPPSLFANKVKLVREIRGNLGRDSSQFDNCLYIFISIASDQESAYRSVEHIKHTLIWPELFEEGCDLKLPERHKDFSYMDFLPMDADSREKMIEIGKTYSKRSIFDFNLLGSAKDCINRMEEYISAGVNHFLLHNFSADPESSFRILTGEIIPSLR
jgi:alkanesulfonate monooxygenase SsuD/methylene tetrahydromethanopterin reductase-like flavin-dependent oxidoreductase (luciferase family)